MSHIKSPDIPIDQLSLNEGVDLLHDIPQDSSPLLTHRYEQWSSILLKYQNFVDGYQSLAASTVKHLEKVSKQLMLDTQLPHFDDATQISSVQADSKANAATATTHNPTAVEDGIHGFFESLKRMTSENLLKATEFENNIQTQVLPEIKTLIVDIANKKKQYQSDANKQAKELQRLVLATTKDVSKLQESVRMYEASRTQAVKIDFRSDPYIVKRSIMHDANMQIKQENVNVENSVNDELNFEVFEKNIIATLKKNFQLLSSYNTEFFQTTMAGGMTAANEDFAAMSDMFEWGRFQEHHQNELLSNKDNTHAGANTKKNLDMVAFANQNHVSTEPILEGLLLRKDRNPVKNIGKTAYISGYYVISKSKYLFEYSSNSETDASPQPNATYFLPDCKLSHYVPKKSETGKPVRRRKFVLEGKDSTSFVSSIMAHKKSLVLKASNEEDMLIWFNILSEATGLMMSAEEERSHVVHPTSPATDAVGNLSSVLSDSTSASPVTP